MFLTDPIVWLQTWSSPGVTRTLEVISWFGYTRVAIAFAVLVAFAFHLRAGLALLLLLGVNSLAIDAAKTTAALPRPFAVDADVRILGWPAPAAIRWGTAATGWWDLPSVTPPPSRAVSGERANDADSETGFGFPSGHVSTAVAFVAGLVGFARLQRGWVRSAGLIWLSVMAVSRLYLGRHFIGDVLGGLVLGAGVVALGMTALRLSALATSRVPHEVERAARINAFVAAGLVLAALIAGRPDVGDAGRLLGIAAGVACQTRFGMLHLPSRPMARAGLVTIAAVTYGLVWAALTFGLPLVAAGLSDLPSRTLASHGHRLAASALPAFAMLLVPAAIANRHRTTLSPEGA